MICSGEVRIVGIYDLWRCIYMEGKEPWRIVAGILGVISIVVLAIF